MPRFDPSADTPDPSDYACECGVYPDGGTPSAPTYSECTCEEEAEATWHEATPLGKILAWEPAAHLGLVAAISEEMRMARETARYLARVGLAPLLTDARAHGFGSGRVTLTGRTVPAPADTLATTREVSVVIDRDAHGRPRVMIGGERQPLRLVAAPAAPLAA